MFSGIIREIGQVKELRRVGEENAVLTLEASLLESQGIGDSVCVSGVCLTVVERNGRAARFDVASETLRRTTLGTLRAGNFVNLEGSLTFGAPVHGHFVLGHVDCSVIIESVLSEGETRKMIVRYPEMMRQFTCEKGSIALDGVSLTIGEVTDNTFAVYLIPETLRMTTLGERVAGDSLNCEADCLARYVQRAIEHYR